MQGHEQFPCEGGIEGHCERFGGEQIGQDEGVFFTEGVTELCGDVFALLAHALHELELAQAPAEHLLGFSIKLFAHIAGEMIMADAMGGLEGFALAGLADLSA